MKFESLSLCEPLLRSIEATGYELATPIQEQAIPPILEGRDVIGCAQTGTGKTAAFALPTLQRLMPSSPSETSTHPARWNGGDHPSTETRQPKQQGRAGRRPIRALILAPTRELAGQIGASLKTYGKFTGLRHAVIFGGVGQGPQVRELQAGVDILVATPGRLLDLVEQRFVRLDAVEILILDEADHMLDMGFIHDLRRIVALVPERRQTLLFSATMPPEIRQLAGQWLRQPFELQVTPVASTPERVSQSVYYVEREQKAATLTRFLQTTPRSRTLIFSRTKHGADKIARVLQRNGIAALAIHGNKSQATRQAVMRAFKSEEPPVLVATDLAARGLDISDVSHVINYDLPDAPETYVHRIGRTARAGASGQAVSFCSRDERARLRLIEKLMRQTVPVKMLPAAANGHAAQPEGESRESQGANGESSDSRSFVDAETSRTSERPSKRFSENSSKRPHKFRFRRKTRPASSGAANHASGRKPSHGKPFSKRFKNSRSSAGHKRAAVAQS